ncbi:hypothetical protein BSL78_20200 [Apostichopus japonicus]|uniref:NACHT domain-containing protein n=1 Tax=Stichopus japonicus TaxID=307972 RepID=A0A2G8K4L4_STIJA|nr:hypothetical protein BSL78_20200 [Apostichopus japonicus]
MNTVDELLAALFKDPKDKRVLFIGESGSGKSRLFRTMAKKWMDGKILQDEILIYLQLEYLSRDSNILEELAASLRSDNNSVTVDSLRMILQNKRSIVMLDGRSNLDRFHNTTQNNDNTNGLTVKQLLIGKDIDQYKKMKIWITYRNLEDASQDMKESKDKVTIVKLLGFNDLQRQGFFARALSVDENSIKDISETWKFYIEEHFNETLDGRYSSPLIAQLFVSYVLQKDTIRHLMTFTKSKWNELEKVGNFDILVCLLEAFFQDKNEYKERAKTFQQKQLVFRRITDDYFQEATLHLWQELNDNDRQLKTLEIYGDCPVRLMEYLPTVTDLLVFHNIHSSENYNDYKSITETAFKKCNTVKFSDQTLHKEHLTTE